MQVWWVHGPPGVGKSVTSWRLFEDLAAAGVRCAYVDIDQLGMCYPALADDPWRDRLKGRVLAGIAGTFAAAGCERLVVSGVLDPELRRWYADRLAPHDLTLCRLTVDAGELTRRLEARGVDADWVADALEEAHDLESAGLPDPFVDTGTGPASDIAGLVGSALTGASPVLGTGEPDAEPVADEGEAKALWVTGPTAVGTSSVGFGVFMTLRSEATTAYLDLEQLGFVRGPTHPGAALANAAIAWGCFREAGATRLVVVGRLGSAAERRLLADALAPTPVRVIGLTADETAYVERVAARGRGEAPELAGDHLVGADPGHLATMAAVAWAEQQDVDHGLWDASYDTSGRSAAEVAEEVLADWRR